MKKRELEERVEELEHLVASLFSFLNETIKLKTKGEKKENPIIDRILNV